MATSHRLSAKAASANDPRRAAAVTMV